MLTHVVLIRLKDRSRENVEKVREMLLTLKDAVPVVRSLEAGIDALRTERSYDVALTVVFDSLADLDVYQKHPAHVNVAGYIRNIRDAIAVVDYES